MSGRTPKGGELQLLKEIKEWLTNAFRKLKEWWQRPLTEAEYVALTEKYGANIPEFELYGNPIKRWVEKFRSMVEKSTGKGGFITLVACTAVLGFIILTGSATILSVVGISLATVYGAVLAINRFPRLEKFVTRWYKWVDLALFTVMFLMASTIFGLQVAAVTGITSSIALILWKTWKDHKPQIQEFKKKIMEVISQEEPVAAPAA